MFVQGRLKEGFTDRGLWSRERGPVLWNKAECLNSCLLTDGLDVVGGEDLKEPDEGLGVGVVGFAEFGGCGLDLLGVG